MTLTKILSELRAGHPVLVFQTLGLSWIPRFHYAVAIGYDLSARTLLLHTGRSERRPVSLRLFERTWALPPGLCGSPTIPVLEGNARRLSSWIQWLEIGKVNSRPSRSISPSDSTGSSTLAIPQSRAAAMRRRAS